MTSHGNEHVNTVRREARKLAALHAPQYLHLADLAARLHDEGRAEDDETHHLISERMWRADPRFVRQRRALSPEELEIVAEAIREHRASTGRPQHIVAKIVSDADRMGAPRQMNPLKRAYTYALEHGEMPDQAFQHAVEHIRTKYGPGGYGNRTYFPETKVWLDREYEPIFAAEDAGDVKTLRRMVGIDGTAE